MLKFILNDKKVKCAHRHGMTLLDYVRYEQQLVGTKIGCREGDCGACTLLVGELSENHVIYTSLTSCITPLANVHGKHVVTIEGLNMEELTPYQRAMVEESGTQCGFCTVGFIVSFAGECLSYNATSYDSVISAVDGNICRCTGYKSIERAAEKIYNHLKEKDVDNPVSWCVNHGYVPEYFENIVSRLKNITPYSKQNGGLIIGGGTDLIVQKHDHIFESNIDSFLNNEALKNIQIIDNKCHIGASVTATQLIESTDLNLMFSDLKTFIKLIASTPIRNTGTIAGNLVNASPIGDLTAFFLALNSTVVLGGSSNGNREVQLKDFYKNYKNVDMNGDEYLSSIYFDILDDNTYFNFEKVSKRTYLDIASVNSAMSISMTNNRITDIHISAGGVAPIPTYLKKTREALIDREITDSNILSALIIMQDEISPISDARGSEYYKRLLLRQLVWAHFMKLFPHKFELETLQTTEFN